MPFGFKWMAAPGANRGKGTADRHCRLYFSAINL